MALLVLEASWDDDLSDRRTVLPFVAGWSLQANIPFSFRSYNSRADLKYWLEVYYRDDFFDLLYIAGHGNGSRLVGLGGRLINVAPLLGAVFAKRRRPPNRRRKGVLIGACECFDEHARTRVIEHTNSRLGWVAGYSVTLPWLESTLVDIAFINYRYCGRPPRQHDRT